ncbi:MAG TPA: HIT domain-containing protein [Jiangellaceae bacterium]
MGNDCLFCSIVAGDAPSEQVAAGDGVIAIRDIYPRAPVHVLIIPHEHIDSAHELTADHADLLSRCFALARDVADAEGTADGYRVTTNVGSRGGQAIKHLHFHVLGGRQLRHIDSGEPPAN